MNHQTLHQDPHDITSALYVLALLFSVGLWLLTVVLRCCGIALDSVATRAGNKRAQRRQWDRQDRATIRRAMAEMLADPETLEMLRNQD